METMPIFFVIVAGPVNFHIITSTYQPTTGSSQHRLPTIQQVVVGCCSWKNYFQSFRKNRPYHWHIHRYIMKYWCTLHSFNTNVTTANKFKYRLQSNKLSKYQYTKHEALYLHKQWKYA